jgi:hypothetical protein
MTSGSKYRIVGWGLLQCSGLFWRLLDDEVKVLVRVLKATSWQGRLRFASKSSWWSTQLGWLPPYS